MDRRHLACKLQLEVSTLKVQAGSLRPIMQARCLRSMLRNFVQMIEARLVLTVVAIGMVGWFLRPLFALAGDRSTVRDSWLTFLCGFGFVSLLLLLFGALGVFKYFPLGMLLAVLAGMWKWKFRFAQAMRGTARYAAFLLLPAFLSVILYRVVPPFETVVMSEDSSVFFGTAFHLHKSGSFSYVDPVLQEMTDLEKETLTRNRFTGDWTGPGIRFPGGVPVIDSKTSRVSFSFSHLFPSWLAFAIPFIGYQGFPAILSMFFAVSLISVAFIAHALAGRVAAVGVPLCLFCFYLQQYFSRYPIAELIAQPLFLAGLSIWASAQQPARPASNGEQALLGIVWGAFLFSRIDSLYFLGTSLVAAFALIPVLRRNAHGWRVLILSLLAFSFLALFYVVVSQTYLYLFSERAFFGGKGLNHVLLGVVVAVEEIVRGFPAISGLILILFIATAFTLLYRSKPSPAAWRIVLPACFIVALILHLLLILSSRTATTLAERIGWFQFYFPLPLLVVLLAGLAASVPEIQRSPALHGTLLLLFVIPTAFFLARPLVQHYQPMAMRRFFPMVLSLFLLLSISGIRACILRVFSRRAWMAEAAFVLILCALSLTLLKSGTGALLRPIYAGVLQQTLKIAESVPPDALVVMPDSLASVHMETPLQFLSDRSTLLLPLDYAKDRKTYPIVDGYLRRQLGSGRTVVALSSDSEAPVAMLRKSFGLQHEAKGVLQFNRVLATPLNRAPEGIENVTQPYSIYLIQEESFHTKKRIDFNDANVAFLNFHEPENGFRWTNSPSLIVGFEYIAPPPATSIRLKLGPRGPSFAPPRIRINEMLLARFVKEVGDTLYYEVEHSTALAIRSAQFESGIFVPGAHDTRKLGISFVSLEFL